MPAGFRARVGGRWSKPPASAHTSTPAKAAAPPGEPPVASAPGVSPRDIKIGMSAAFKGAQAGLGTELWRGATAYYTDLNARGGVNGRQLAVIALDDDYQP